MLRKIFLAWIIGFCGTLPASAGDLIITFMQGQVEIQKSNAKTWERARTGLILNAGDKIRTGKGGQASTTSKEGHKILIKEKTTFQISQLGPIEWDFQQDRGRARLTVAKLGQGQSLRVKTPTALCAVRGTEFEVTVRDDLSTQLDVFKGLVSFGNPERAAPEIAVAENQRSAVQEGSAPKSPESIPEPDRRRDSEEKQRIEKLEQKPVFREDPRQDPKQDPKRDERSPLHDPEQEEKLDKREGRDLRRDPDSGRDVPRDARSFGRESFDEREVFRQEIAKEVQLDLTRDSFEHETAFELQANEYQQARTLVDAFGQRVRLEEYVTRPTPESFKFVSLNTRDNRLDFATFEVVANRPLPQNLEEAGNLWFSVGDQKPAFYAVKQRFHSTNGRDAFLQIDLDGDSLPVTFQEAQFSDTGLFLGVTKQTGFQTVFNHRYEFLNGDPGGLERLWNDASFRPRDNGILAGIPVTGMMWHMQPILIERFDPLRGVTESFWRDAFVATAGSGNTATGKMEVTIFEPDPDPNLAHFIEKHQFVNFVDSNGNGRLDQGESFEDRNGNRLRDPDEPFEDVVQLGLDGSKDVSRRFDGTADRFFSDLNRDGLDNDRTAGTDAFSVAQRPWAWLTNESFIVDDFGKVLDFRESGFGDLSRGSDDPNQIASAFEQLNYERVWTSSEFGDRKIDVVMTPRLLLKSGFVDAKRDERVSIDQR